MKPRSFMLIAGEASGDLLAAELVQTLRDRLASAEAVPSADPQPLHASLEPRFFGAGGPRMAAAGVDLAFDMTAHSIIGPSEALKNYFKFRRFFHQLYQLALERQPDAVICVDFSVFNRQFARALKRHIRARLDWFHPWNPKIVQYVSPQVWASREGRAYQMPRAYDLVLSTFAFEKDWYASRVPQLRVEFVGNPILDRYSIAERGVPHAESTPLSSSVSHPAPSPLAPRRPPLVLLLPGSRKGELRRHLPLLIQVARNIAAELRVEFRMVLPNDSLAEYARGLEHPADKVTVQIGGLEQALAGTDLAIAKSGTITVECACLGVPAVVFYKTSIATYLAARQMVKVKHIAMPNLLAKEEIFPEFIQGAATAENIARAALELLRDEGRRQKVKARLAEVVGSLGGPGASRRAAQAIVRLLEPETAVF